MPEGAVCELTIVYHYCPAHKVLTLDQFILAVVHQPAFIRRMVEEISIYTHFEISPFISDEAKTVTFTEPSCAQEFR